MEGEGQRERESTIGGGTVGAPAPPDSLQGFIMGLTNLEE